MADGIYWFIGVLTKYRAFSLIIVLYEIYEREKGTWCRRLEVCKQVMDTKKKASTTLVAQKTQKKLKMPRSTLYLVYR